MLSLIFIEWLKIFVVRNNELTKSNQAQKNAVIEARMNKNDEPG